jgi:mRNA-degrading endonuclease toxin of MazEF toxin-antitoxin module
VNRGEVWLAEIGRKRCPVLVLTRTEVFDLRLLVTVAEISTSARGLAAEVSLDQAAFGPERASVVNCDGLHTVPQAMLTKQVGVVDDETMQRVCVAVGYALGC